MSSAFSPKDEKVANRALRVQELCLNFTVLGHATPASKTVTKDEPSILYLNFEGLNQTTAALETGDTAPTYAAPADATGIFNVLIDIGEPVAKVLAAQCIPRNIAAGAFALTLPSAPATGVIAGTNGDKIALNGDTAVDLSAANLLDACIAVKYMASPR